MNWKKISWHIPIIGLFTVPRAIVEGEIKSNDFYFTSTSVIQGITIGFLLSFILGGL